MIERILGLVTLVWLVGQWRTWSVPYASMIAIGWVLLALSLGLGWGFRWQLLPLLVVGSLLVLGWVLPAIAWPKWIFWVGNIGGILLVLTGAALSECMPARGLPAPTGPYGVGKQQVLLGEHDIHLWYPADPLTLGKTAVYHPNARQAFDGTMGMPGWLFAHLSRYPTDAILQAPMMAEVPKRPLVLYLHGASSMTVDNTALMQELASHGFIAAALPVNFSMEAAGISPELARTATTEAQTSLVSQLIEKALPHQVARVEQMYQLLVSHLTAEQWPIAKDQLAIIGHSFGGTTGLKWAAAHQPTAVVVSLDGPVDISHFPEASTPVLYFSSFDPAMPAEEVSRKRVPLPMYVEVKTKELAAVQQLMQGENRTWIRQSEAGHLDLTDLPFLLPLMKTPGYDHKQGHADRVALITAWLNRRLKGSPDDRPLPIGATLERVKAP